MMADIDKHRVKIGIVFYPGMAEKPYLTPANAILRQAIYFVLFNYYTIKHMREISPRRSKFSMPTNNVVCLLR